MLRFALTTLLLALLAALTPNLAAHEIELKTLKFVHPWTHEPATGVTDISIYMTIRNSGGEPDRIVGASSPLARDARVVSEKPAASGQPSIEIPAGGSIKLSKDGAHIDLLGLTEPLAGYEMFPMWLTLEKAGRVEVEVMVEENPDVMTGHPTPAPDPPAPHDHGHEAK